MIFARGLSFHYRGSLIHPTNTFIRGGPELPVFPNGKTAEMTSVFDRRRDDAGCCRRDDAGCGMGQNGPGRRCASAGAFALA